MTGLFDDHLSLDVIVAYADGEMGLTAYQRAATHLMSCALCAADVAEQTVASQYLRQADGPVMPGSLFDTLKSIPVAAPHPVAVGAPHPDAQGHPRPRRFRLGAGVLVAGIAVGGIMAVGGGAHPGNTSTTPRRPAQPIVVTDVGYQGNRTTP